MTFEKSNQSNEKKTMWVVILTAFTMVTEIVFGKITHSMALLADGIHMGSHVLAIGLSWMAYVAVRRISGRSEISINGDKLLSLSGFSSGLLLLIFAMVIIAETIGRIYNPVTIQFKDAILVAVIGLAVNIISAFLLHNKSENHDHNLKAAYLHVLADALTSVVAIIGLTAGMIWNIVWVDALGAMIGSIVIIRWSVKLLKEAGVALIDLKRSE